MCSVVKMHWKRPCVYHNAYTVKPVIMGTPQYHSENVHKQVPFLTMLTGHVIEWRICHDSEIICRGCPLSYMRAWMGVNRIVNKG